MNSVRLLAAGVAAAVLVLTAAPVLAERDPRCKVPGAVCTIDGQLLQPAEETVVEGPTDISLTNDPRAVEWRRQQELAMPRSTSGTPQSPVVAVDMKKVNFQDAQPMLDPVTGRVRLPLRAVAEAMGADVRWDPAKQQVTVRRDGLTVELWVGNTTARVNGKPLYVDAPPIVVPPGRVMVPLRFIAEAFGANVDWVGSTPPETHPWWPGRYQVWIWVPWGYWGTTPISGRKDGWVMYTKDGRINW